MKRCLAVVCLFALVLTAPAAEAETVKTRINANNTKIFTVIPDDDGVVSITVIARKTTPFVLIAVDGAGEITWCSGVSDERMIRCEFSGIGGDIVDFGLLTARGGTPVHINVTGPVDEFILRADATRRRALETAATALRERLLR